MIKSAFSFLLFAVLLTAGCSNSQSKTASNTLTAKAFYEKTKQYPTAKIIDVRTPEEFAKGHLQRAINIDWQTNQFEKEVSGFDKSEPIFVYCLSGGRSSAAANKMRAMGFKEVYEMEGGILKWRMEGLPEAADTQTQTEGMSRSQFEALTASDKIVLVDFYADWCAPCKKMKPSLDEIGQELADKVKVIRINADENPQLCRDLGIDALPTLQVYRDHKMSWSHTGYIDKADIIIQLQ